MKKTCVSLFFCLLCAGLILVAACGGGGGASGHSGSSTPQPTVNLNLSPQSIQSGQTATLAWTTSNATSVQMTETAESSALGNEASRATSIRIAARTAQGPIFRHEEGEPVKATATSEPLNGSLTVSPSVTTTYTLTATGPGGTAQAEATLMVTSAPAPEITALISVSPQSIASGQTATLTWSTTNATSAVLNNQQVDLSGSISVSPASTTTYTLVATGTGGTAQAQITLTVSSPPPSQPTADDLVKTYNIDPIPNSNPETMGKTMRWPNGTVAVYDETGFAGLQSALSAWNAVIGGPVVFALSSDPSSPITITFDSTLASSVCGNASYGIRVGTGGDNAIYQCIVRINPTCGLVTPIYAHEMGHCIGFFAHTQDGGLMDANTGNGQITTEDTTMIHHLYELPVGTYIP